MKNIAKMAFVAFFMLSGLATTNAQQLNEQELKVNVQNIRNSTEQLKQLNPVTFDYDTQKFAKLQLPKGHQYGFLASDVKNVLPDVAKQASQVYSVGKNTTKVATYDSVDSESLIPLLVAAIKEQQEQIEALQKEVQKLKENNK